MASSQNLTLGNGSTSRLSHHVGKPQHQPEITRIRGVSRSGPSLSFPSSLLFFLHTPCLLDKLGSNPELPWLPSHSLTVLLEAAGATFNPLHRPFPQARGFAKELAASCPALRGKPGEKRSWGMSITLPTSVPIPGALYKPIRSNNSRKHKVCELILNASFSFSFPCSVFIAFQIQPLKKKIAFISPRREKCILFITLCSQQKINFILIVRQK